MTGLNLGVPLGVAYLIFIGFMSQQHSGGVGDLGFDGLNSGGGGGGGDVGGGSASLLASRVAR